MRTEVRLTRRQFLSSVGAAAGSMALAACAAPGQPAAAPAAPQAGAPAGEVTTIVYWHGWEGRFAAWLDRAATAFHEDNPDLKVEFVQTTWDEMYPKLLTAVASGSPPDSYVAGNEEGQLYSLAANKVIMAIEDIAPEDVANLKEDVHPSIWEIGTYEGKMWALPKWTQSYELLVNTDYLAEAGIDPEAQPETFEELDALVEKLFQRDADGTIRRIGFDPGNWYFNYWGRFKGQYVDDNGEPTATHENNVKCVEWMTSYSQKYDPTLIAQFREAVTGSDATQPFLTGMFAIELNGPWRLGDIYEFKPDMPYKVWRLPRPASVEGWGMSTGGDIPVIPTGAPNPQASYRWCRYLIGVDNPAVYSTFWTEGLRPHMPISEKVARGPEFAKVYEMFPGFDLYVDDFFGGDWWAPPAKLPVAQFYADRLNSHIQQARLLLEEPTAALEAVQKETVDELTKWRDANNA